MSSANQDDSTTIRLDALERGLRESREHQSDFEREIRDRMMRIETIMSTLATREDMANFRATVTQLQEAAKQFALVSENMATKTDLDWIKKFLWWGMGALSALLCGLAGLILSHVFAGKP